MAVPMDIIPRIKCIKCKHILSLLPVYILEDGKNICGRCSISDEINPKPNNVYNEIATLLQFPCTFYVDGCKEMLNTKDVFKHELNCLYRDQICPNSSQCDWTGNYKHLWQHYEESHQNLIIRKEKTDIDLDIEQKFLKITYLLNKFEKLFLIEVETYNGDLFIVVSLLKFQQQTITYNYNLKLDFSNIVQNLSICTQKRKIELHKSSQPTILNTTAYRINLKETFKNINSLHFQVAITDTDKKLETSHQKLLNPVLLKKIECPICFETLMPPIYICGNGHTICTECKSKVVVCPTCKKQDFVRNRILEDVMQDIVVPCKHCSATIPVPDMVRHVGICPYAPRTCPIATCGVEGDLYEHLKTSHKARFRDYKQQFVSIKTPVEGKVDRVWKFGDVLLKVNILIKTMCVFDIALLQSSSPGDVYFILEFKGADKEQSFCIKRKCHSLDTNDIKRVLLLPLDSLLPFIDMENFVEYNITIVQK